MKRISLSYYILSVSLLSVFSLQQSYAQSYKQERALENRIVDAVSDFNDGRYGEAAEKLESIAAADPDNDAAHYYLGMADFLQNDYAAAEEELQAAVRLDSTNFWYRYRLAAVYAATDRKELTVDIYNGLLRDFPKKSDIYYSLIDLYLSMGRLEDALSTLDQIDTVFGKNDISIMTRFDIGEGMQGLIGVVGPTRMDYAQITARLSYFAENLGRMFGKPELPPSHQEGTGDD